MHRWRLREGGGEMNEKKVKAAILGLENVVEKAKELHAITLIQYDSFTESDAFPNNSEVYKTITSIIERNAMDMYEGLKASFDELYALTNGK